MNNYTKSDWSRPSPYAEAIKDMFEDYSDNETISGHEALEAVLKWNGYGLTTEKIIDMVETFIGRIEKY